MRLSIEFDDDLLNEAMRAAGTSTAQATVEAGLAELVRRHQVRKVRELRGTVEWAGDLDGMRSGLTG